MIIKEKTTRKYLKYLKYLKKREIKKIVEKLFYVFASLKLIVVRYRSQLGAVFGYSCLRCQCSKSNYEFASLIVFFIFASLGLGA